jgi:RNA polymerase sigma-70 factor (ECF subfamily)
MTQPCTTWSGDAQRRAPDRTGEHPDIYRRLRQRIERIVRSTFGADSECPDVAQDVFLEIVRSGEKLKDLNCLESWASTVATYTVRRELRRRRRRRWVLCDVEESPELRYEPDTELAEVSNRFAQALHKLPCEERQILIQRALNGCSMSELASDLGCSLSTARRRLNQARERLMCIARRDPALRPRLKAGLNGRKAREVCQ